MEHIYNCHSHIFTNRNVPLNFLPWGILRYLSKRRVSRKLGKFMNRLNPWSNDDIFDRFAAFMNIGNFATQLEIFEFVKGFYPEITKFIVLSMDMEYMKAGTPRDHFKHQLEELADVKKKYPDHLLPFIAVDPRRPHIFDLVKEFIEEHQFAGIKLYPPLGYYPFDERLYPIYEYAQNQQIPIISHCSRGGVYYRGQITKQMLVHPRTGEKFDKTKSKHFVNNFTNPQNYEFLLNDFPKLKICLAHFGGDKEWKSYLTTSWDRKKEKSWFSMILDLIRKYDNIYTDVAYTMYDIKFHALLKVILQDQKIRSRILYGSDYYMVEMDISERAYSINLRAYLGEEDYRQIAEINPQTFLLTL